MKICANDNPDIIVTIGMVERFAYRPFTCVPLPRLEKSHSSMPNGQVSRRSGDGMLGVMSAPNCGRFFAKLACKVYSGTIYDRPAGTAAQRLRHARTR